MIHARAAFYFFPGSGLRTKTEFTGFTGSYANREARTKKVLHFFLGDCLLYKVNIF